MTYILPTEDLTLSSVGFKGTPTVSRAPVSRTLPSNPKDFPWTVPSPFSTVGVRPGLGAPSRKKDDPFVLSGHDRKGL